MPRKGWRTIEVPDGWLQVLRGPRPLAERWPMAQRGGGRQKERQRRAQQRDQPRQFQETSFPQPRRGDFRGGRVGKLEVAINASGEDDPAVTELKEAHRRARWTIASRTKMFIERSRKRVDSVREEITMAQEAKRLEDGSKRLNSLEQEADGLSEQPPPPTAPADFARELAELRACVQALQVERDDLRAEVARQNVEGRPRNARSLAVPSPDPMMGDNSMQLPSVLAIRSGRNSSSVMETLIDQADSSVKSNHRFSPMWQWHRSISAQYGLRGIRVGEASHPGPVSRAKSRRTQMDSDSDAPLVNSGRLMALSRDSDGSDEEVGAEPASRQSGKRPHVTRRDRARASPGDTFTRDPSSVSEALESDLTQLDCVRVVPRRRLVLHQWRRN